MPDGLKLKERQETRGVGEEWIKGTKAIVPFMRQYVDLHADQREAWRTLKRWKKLYHFPIEEEPNGRPYVIKTVVKAWFKTYTKVLKGG